MSVFAWQLYYGKNKLIVLIPGRQYRHINQYTITHCMNIDYTINVILGKSTTLRKIDTWIHRYRYRHT